MWMLIRAVLRLLMMHIVQHWASSTHLQEVCLMAWQVHVERLCKSIEAHLQRLVLEQQLFCPTAEKTWR
jgi:hypothetical protein